MPSVTIASSGPPLGNKAQFRVVVGFDFSELSRRAVSEALRICSTQPGAALHVITVGLSALSPTARHTEEAPGLVDQEAAEAARTQVAELARGDGAGAGAVELEGIQIHAVVGSTAECIVALAKAVSANLIVLGTHGRRGLPRLFHGSVAEAVVRSAPCGVLVIREGVASQYLDRMNPGSSRQLIAV